MPLTHHWTSKDLEAFHDRLAELLCRQRVLFERWRYTVREAHNAWF